MSRIIYQPWGGLGDNLAHSLIPELCHQHGMPCYLSRQNVVRNEQIHELIWELNPYINAEKKDYVDMSWLDRCAQFEVPGLNHIQVVQKAYGFDTNYEYPKIYYTPTVDSSFKGKTLIDLSIYSVAGEYSPQNISNIIKQFDLDEDTLAVTHSNVTYGTLFDTADKYKKIDITSLESYSNILASCKRFITLYSGQANLASTIKNQIDSDLEINVITLNRYMPHNTCGYTFSNTNYISSN
jgi:hypothetical protein